MKDTRQWRLLCEFFRYAVVGGISAVLDMAVLWAVTTFVFDGVNTGLALAISVAAGFLVGLLANYLLSVIFVFTTGEQKQKSRSAKAFCIYAAVGLIGFLLTEGLMHLGMLFVSREGLWYLVLNLFVKAVVLVWNYAGRKIFVYRGN